MNSTAAKEARSNSGAAFVDTGINGKLANLYEYSRFFFDYPGTQGLDLRYCGENFFKHLLVIVTNEISLFIGGYYSLAAICFVLAWVAVPCVYICDVKKGGGQLKWRRWVMSFAWFLLDYSVLEMAMILIIGPCKSSLKQDTKKKYGESSSFKSMVSVGAMYNELRDKEKLLGAWMSLCIMIPMRFLQMLVASLLLPFTVVFMAIYMTYTFFGRQGFWTCCSCYHAMRDKEGCLFGDYRIKDEAATWSLMPWEWKGIGYGGYEFFDGDDVFFIVKQQASPFTVQSGTKMKRQQKQEEIQSLVKGKTNKSHFAVSPV